MPSLNRDLAASVLMDALYTTDEKACHSYGVSVRTLQRWRRLLADGDPELIAIVAAKRTAADLAWANKLPAVLFRASRQSRSAARLSGTMRTPRRIPQSFTPWPAP